MAGVSEPVAPAPVPADLPSSAGVPPLPSASQEGPEAEAIVPPFGAEQAASGEAPAAADLAAFEVFKRRLESLLLESRGPDLSQVARNRLYHCCWMLESAVDTWACENASRHRLALALTPGLLVLEGFI